MSAPKEREEVFEDNRDFGPRTHLYLAGGVIVALVAVYFISLKLVLG